MNTENLPRFADIGGVTNGQFYGLQITTRNGQSFETGLDDADLAKILSVLLGLAADAATVVPASPAALRLPDPLPVANLMLQPGRTPGEVILGIQTGKVTLPLALHQSTLVKLFAALQQARTS